MSKFFPDELARSLRNVQDKVVENVIGLRAVLYRNRDDLGLGPRSEGDVDEVDQFYNDNNIGDTVNYDDPISTRLCVNKDELERTKEEELDNEEQDPLMGLGKPSDQVTIGSYYKIPFTITSSEDLSQDVLTSEGEVDKVIRVQVVGMESYGVDNTAKISLRLAKMRTDDQLASSDNSDTDDIPGDFFTD